MLKCGAYEAVVTPKLGMTIPGYFVFRIADGILDDLYAKAVVFDDGTSVCGFVAIDILHVTAKMTHTIRHRFTELTGVDSSAIMVSGTHAHTGLPIEHNDEFSRVEDEWIQFTCDRAADALCMAYNRRVECVLAYASGEERELSFNRRFFMRDGKAVTWPGIGNPDNVRPAAPVDYEISVVRVQKTNGTPIAVITNFANHLDLIGGTKYSADYPGVLSTELKKRLGNGVVSLFLNGCCGDVTHIDYTGAHPFGADHYIKSGKILANDVLRLFEHVEVIENAQIAYRTVTKTIPRRQFTREQYEAAKRELAEYDKKTAPSASDDGEFEKPSTGNADDMAKSYLKCTINLYENPIQGEDVEMQSIRLGSLLFCGMSGEMFAETGLDFKAKSPFDKTMIVELANGCFGYIATKHAFNEGGYEVTLDRYVNLSEDAADIISDTLLRQAKELVQ